MMGTMEKGKNVWVDTFFPHTYSLTLNQLDELEQAIINLKIANEKGSNEEVRKRLNKLIYKGEMCMLSARRSMEGIDKNNGEFFDESLPGCIENLPCNVEFNEEALIVKTPLTLKRGDSKSKHVLKENYQLAQYVCAAIRKWQFLHPDIDLWHHPNFIGGDLIFIVIRKAIAFNRNVLCDNDNLENGKIQNEVCRVLGIGDDCRILDLYSCFRLAKNEEEVGTEFILTKRKNLQNYV